MILFTCYGNCKHFPSFWPTLRCVSDIDGQREVVSWPCNARVLRCCAGFWHISMWASMKTLISVMGRKNVWLRNCARLVVAGNSGCPCPQHHTHYNLCFWTSPISVILMVIIQFYQCPKDPINVHI